MADIEHQFMLVANFDMHLDWPRSRHGNMSPKELIPGRWLIPSFKRDVVPVGGMRKCSKTAALGCCVKGFCFKQCFKQGV